jgi:hypothetical protein
MTKIADGMGWFKQTFRTPAEAGIKGTPFTLDLLAAIAVQESFEIWGGLWQRLRAEELLPLCVGDTLDAPNRSTFPTSKSELVGAPNGDSIFQVAHTALEQMAIHVPSYQGAARNPDKFCHGFGIFQYDIQFCTTDSAFFLQREWGDFANCLSKALKELNEAKTRAYGATKTQLSDTEMVYVAIDYNQGRVNTHGSFKQGFFDHDSGKFYGELISEYLAVAKSVN